MQWLLTWRFQIGRHRNLSVIVTVLAYHMVLTNNPVMRPARAIITFPMTRIDVFSILGGIVRQIPIHIHSLCLFEKNAGI